MLIVYNYHSMIICDLYKCVFKQGECYVEFSSVEEKQKFVAYGLTFYDENGSKIVVREP